MLDIPIISITQLLITCLVLGCPLGMALAHEFPIRKRIIKIKEDKK